MQTGFKNEHNVFCLPSVPEIEERIEVTGYGEGIVKGVWCDGTWNWISILLLETLQGQVLVTWKFQEGLFR